MDVCRKRHRAPLLYAVCQAKGVAQFMKCLFHKPRQGQRPICWQRVKFLAEPRKRDNRDSSSQLSLAINETEHRNKKIELSHREQPHSVVWTLPNEFSQDHRRTVLIALRVERVRRISERSHPSHLKPEFVPQRCLQCSERVVVHNTNSCQINVLHPMCPASAPVVEGCVSSSFEKGNVTVNVVP